MESRNALKALEKLNLERIYYFESKDYRNLLRVNKVLESFPMHLIPLIINHKKNKRIREKVKLISTPIEREQVEYADPLPEGLTGVAYTCITSGYDLPKEPLYNDPNLTYLLYTDLIEDMNTIWNQKEIKDVPVLSNSNYANRYYKFHPFELFKGQYDYSIYIDGNVQLISDTSSLFSIARDSNLGIAMHRHATMDCVYKNALWCKYNHRGNVDAIEAQVKKYQDEGFPKDFGLLEATIIVIDLHNDIAQDILNSWWDEFINSNGGRDQISLPYILWKKGYSVDDVGYLGNDEYHNPKFRINEHIGKPL